MRIQSGLLVLFLLLLSLNGIAAVKKEGTFNMNIGAEPTTLNPITSTDVYSRAVHGYVLDTLLTQDIDTYEWKPGLAESYKISDDKMTFEFTLRNGAKWHDGKPVTVEDVKFSYDVLFNPKYNTAHLRPYFEGIKSLEIAGPNVIKVTAKDKYYKNFDVIAGSILRIIPKHIYNDESKSKEWSKNIIGSGPYSLDKYEKGKRIVLKRNKDWWGKDIYKDEYNFEKINMRFVSEENISLEMLKKGELDFEGMTPESFVKKSEGKEWGTKVFKVKTENQGPKGYGFIGFNLNHPIFQDKRVRKALTHLMNRELMIEKFLFNMSELATGPFYKQSYYASKNVQALNFDPKKALKLLEDAGWKDSDGDQILDKIINGKKTKLSFTILEPLPDFMKYLTIFKEDAKKAGVEVNLQNVEWNSFVKLLDERKFDAVRLAWSGGDIDWEPKQIWHSDSMAGGSNFVGYKNDEVDRLIEKARLIYSREERAKILRKVYEIVADDAPYIFLFNSKYSLYGHTKKAKRPKDTFTYGVGVTYWWME